MATKKDTSMAPAPFGFLGATKLAMDADERIQAELKTQAAEGRKHLECKSPRPDDPEWLTKARKLYIDLELAIYAGSQEERKELGERFYAAALRANETQQSGRRAAGRPPEEWKGKAMMLLFCVHVATFYKQSCADARALIVTTIGPIGTDKSIDKKLQWALDGYPCRAGEPKRNKGLRWAELVHAVLPEYRPKKKGVSKPPQVSGETLQKSYEAAQHKRQSAAGCQKSRMVLKQRRRLWTICGGDRAWAECGAEYGDEGLVDVGDGSELRQRID